jgi:predicted RND superfamily exporter protein
MPRTASPRLLRTWPQLAALLVCVALGAALFAFVDLTPRVEADFFFSTDDPQLQQSIEIERQFGTAPQVFIDARAPRLASRQYLLRLRALTADLRGIAGVTEVRSLAHGPAKADEVAELDVADVFESAAESPFWSRLLLAPDRSSTFVVLDLRTEDQTATIDAIDQVLVRHAKPDFQLGASGVPYVSEHIRRQLARDLRVFSLAAFGAFALLVGLLFRSLAVVTGTMVAALTACFGTFLIRALLGMRTDVLTPNLWTIAFVLTLSHIVYLTAQWRRQAREHGPEAAMRDAVRLVGPASAWSLAANLLGFASLILVTAKPLREFGMSGVIAALSAMICAFVVYPPFLRAAAPGRDRDTTTERRLDRFFTTRHSLIAAVVIVAALGLAPFAWRVNTDPSLPSYFAEGDRIRAGLDAIDRAGGSSPLDVVVADAGGRPLDTSEAFDRLEALQTRLERHEDVGATLSIALLMAETKRPWYSFLFSWDTRLDQLDKAKHGRVGRTFINADRTRGRFILRMREAARTRPREAVVGEIEAIIRRHGFKPVLVGGLYPLQGELSQLVEGSVIRGLGGLIALFGVIVWLVTRSLPTALAMTACLAITPFALFGLVGLFRMPVDIISAPAANVALPLGIDEMIHLGYTVRRSRTTGGDVWKAWKEALAHLWQPILISMLVVASGFALFLFSSFPPTRRLGALVCTGAVLTDLVVLLVLPAVVTWRIRRRSMPRV